MKKLAVVVAVVFLSACAATAPGQSFAPIVASDADREPFHGLWRGHLEAVDERYTGDVEFRFETGGALLLAGRTTPSRILWVRIQGSQLSGALEPYFDPARGTEVYTLFEATLHEGVLRGVFRERARMQWSQTGTWTAFRVGD